MSSGMLLPLSSASPKVFEKDIVGVWFYGLDLSFPQYRSDDPQSLQAMMQQEQVWVAVIRMLFAKRLRRKSASTTKSAFLIQNFFANGD